MKKRVGIIGGGILGTSVGYFLSQYPDAEVTIFEKNTIGSGTTAKSAATFCLIDDSVSHEFWSVRLFGFKFYTNLEKKYPGIAPLRLYQCACILITTLERSSTDSSCHPTW